MSAKKGNVAAISALLAVDAAILLYASGQSLLSELSPTGAARIAVLGAAPPIVYLASSIFSAQAKARLVFWRISNPLPSHRAFSEAILDDPRIDVIALRTKIGEFPVDARDQGVAWYKLYSGISAREEVVDANKRYLYFRDAATVSLLLTILAPAVLAAYGGRLGAAIGVFAVQFVLCAIAARIAGNRLVNSVLAVASHAP